MLSLEHSGRPANSNDGCCLSLLLSVKVLLLMRIFLLLNCLHLLVFLAPLLILLILLPPASQESGLPIGINSCNGNKH